MLNSSRYYHPFHIVANSWWPLYCSCALAATLTSMMFMLGNFPMQNQLLLMNFLSLCMVFGLWCTDVVKESTFQGNHTTSVSAGMSLSFYLFVASEMFVFLSVFWAYFHSSFSPTYSMGLAWPPCHITTFNPLEMPLLNTILLLTSGVTLTWAHHAMINGQSIPTMIGLILTIGLGLIFTYFQYMEYSESAFDISDSTFGAVFFGTTGLHGVHVIVGTIFLMVSLASSVSYHYTKHHHLGFEMASIYWHFVDIVWLFLYVVVYWLP